MSVFDEIYATKYQEVCRFTQNRCGLQYDIAEQIVSDAFFDLYRALKDDTKIENPVAWLHKTIRIRRAEFLRHELRVKRGGRHRQQKLLDQGVGLAIEDQGFEAVDTADTFQFVWKRLTETEQEIAEMVFMQELNQTEIAHQLGITLRTVERRISRVRNRLRTLLTDALV